MPRQQEKVQRARQLDQDVYPTNLGFLHLIVAYLRSFGTDIITLLHGNRADNIALLRTRRAQFYAHCRHKGAEVYALPLWRKLFYGISITLLLASWLFYWIYTVEQFYCTSEWILDTTAPYHTTNQLCAFADKTVGNFSSPAILKGAKAYGYGTVKLDLQYFDPKVTNGCCNRRHLLYTPLELHYTQYVPERANTISLSQLMQYNNGEAIANRAMLAGSLSRQIGLLMGATLKDTIVWAKDVNGHYVFKARVPNRRCWCPDIKERRIFNSQIEGATNYEMKWREIESHIRNMLNVTQGAQAWALARAAALAVQPAEGSS
ncbi:hypothetical protein JMJ35_006649 [Cladonia borealis]|uniref:Uncharacterized protein n=1 Tax=Cladonia borealis TaxID=184061 RepID=A0AA39QXK4_9LECA|nr:hypothetical protein JMJ35_006649 [Cladonia borealis]